VCNHYRAGEENVRVTTAFNKVLAIPGAVVVSVRFTVEGIVVGVRRRRCRPVCPCGWKGRGVYDRSTRRWRHLDLGGTRLLLEAEIRRFHCRRCCRVRTETVPWARPAARHTSDFEDVVAWLCQHTDKTTVTKLLRTTWETVAAIVVRVVAEHLDHRRLDDLYHIGVDEVSWRKQHRFLTVVADHDDHGAVVWVGEGRDSATLQSFYELLGTDRCAALEAVSMDLGNAYKHATDLCVPQARQCVDPFPPGQTGQRSDRQDAGVGLEARTTGTSDAKTAARSAAC
jgi:transposase